MDRSCFILRDLKEERSDGLSKSGEVGVGRFSVNWLEAVEGVGEFRHNLFGSHAAPAKMARLLSRGSKVDGAKSLGKHREFNKNNHLYRRVP